MIGQRIVHYRTRQDMAISDLVKRTGISNTHLQKIEENEYLLPFCSMY
ncbi:helix-turn-helix domain-containing protein [Alteribacillus sp. YIM 98480]|nr:helix-turn-helix domain-containing protein [Alteribacillus sp. YIM 98480]